MATFTSQTPTGTINGVNAIFTISGTSTAIEVYHNGQLRSETTDYAKTIGTASTTFTFVPAAIPRTSDSLIAWIYTP